MYNTLKESYINKHNHSIIKLHEINILYFRYQYAKQKPLFPEPPKTGTSENQPISLVPAVVGFQTFSDFWQICGFL